MTVYLSFAKDISQHEAQGINLVFFVITMSVSLIYHKLKKRINHKKAQYILLFALPSGILGSLMAKKLSSDILQMLFGAFMLFCGLKSLLGIIKSSSRYNK